MLREGRRQDKRISLAECEERNGFLYYRGRKYVPDYEKLLVKLLRHYHDSPSAGHPGRAKTYGLLSRDYYWPCMPATVTRYVRNCHPCSRNKYSRSAYQGLLSPLPVPDRRWRHVSIDFIVKLPLSNGYDSIMVVADPPIEAEALYSLQRNNYTRRYSQALLAAHLEAPWTPRPNSLRPGRPIRLPLLEASLPALENPGPPIIVIPCRNRWPNRKV
jgi:hypothetical protein